MKYTETIHVATVTFAGEVEPEYQDLTIVGDLIRIRNREELIIMDSERAACLMINRGKVRVEFDDGRWFTGIVTQSALSSDRGYEKPCMHVIVDGRREW